MPTRADFEMAAQLFVQAAGDAADLARSVGATEVDRVMQGGTVSQQLSTTVARSEASAHACVAMIQQAADECSTRAAIIAAYEVELARYDRALASHRGRLSRWRFQYRQWWSSPSDWGHPGSQPRPPVKPIGPPAWAQVRRP